MKKNIILISLVIVVISTIGMIFLVNKTEEEKRVPNNYIAVFRGENGETVYNTYLLEEKKKKKKGKTKYRYINTISTLNTYDSVAYSEKIVKKDKLKKKTDIFTKAEENNATSYVKYNKDGKIYTFEEFKNIWK